MKCLLTHLVSDEDKRKAGNLSGIKMETETDLSWGGNIQLSGQMMCWGVVPLKSV